MHRKKPGSSLIKGKNAENVTTKVDLEPLKEHFVLFGKKEFC